MTGFVKPWNTRSLSRSSNSSALATSGAAASSRMRRSKRSRSTTESATARSRSCIGPVRGNPSSCANASKGRLPIAMRPLRSVSAMPSIVPSISERIKVALRSASSSLRFCSVTSTMKPWR